MKKLIITIALLLFGSLCQAQSSATATTLVRLARSSYTQVMRANTLWGPLGDKRYNRLKFERYAVMIFTYKAALLGLDPSAVVGELAQSSQDGVTPNDAKLAEIFVKHEDLFTTFTKLRPDNIILSSSKENTATPNEANTTTPNEENTATPNEENTATPNEANTATPNEANTGQPTSNSELALRTEGEVAPVDGQNSVGSSATTDEGVGELAETEGKNGNEAMVKTEEENSSRALVPAEGGGALVPTEDGGALVPTEDGEALVPTEDGGALVPTEGGGALETANGEGSDITPVNEETPALPAGENNEEVAVPVAQQNSEGNIEAAGGKTNVASTEQPSQDGAMVLAAGKNNDTSTGEENVASVSEENGTPFNEVIASLSFIADIWVAAGVLPRSWYEKIRPIHSYNPHVPPPLVNNPEAGYFYTISGLSDIHAEIIERLLPAYLDARIAANEEGKNSALLITGMHDLYEEKSTTPTKNSEKRLDDYLLRGIIDSKNIFE